ncbi:FeoC-like transcriptional regulator [Gammaproteobacteria bacterium]|nr:FeoC-like transcriptional regulator [Gammaproteobacteria bacterium]
MQNLFRLKQILETQRPMTIDQLSSALEQPNKIIEDWLSHFIHDGKVQKHTFDCQQACSGCTVKKSFYRWVGDQGVTRH